MTTALLSPAYKLTVGHKLVDTTQKPQASTVVDLTVTLDLDTPADFFRMVLGNADGLKPAIADTVTIELGYDDPGTTQVMSAKVVAVDPGITLTEVIGYSGADALLRTFADKTYESETAGAIVSDLAGQAAIQVSTADDGITFPAYVVDGRRSAWHHMADLADLCGFDLYLDPDGQLVFESFTQGKTTHVLEYGRSLLAMEASQTSPLAEMVEAWGESPTGSQGASAWAWLTSDFSGSKGTAGSGTRFLLERPVLRTADAASAAATAALTTVQRRALRGRLVTLGNADIKLGDAVKLMGLADDALNDTFQVRSVIHRITKAGGFLSLVGFRAI
jgi:phage protein D